MPGQIGLGGAIGQALHEIAARPDVERVLETGTWNGEGSTYCIASGLAHAWGRLTTVEADPALYAEARRYYDGRGLPVELVEGLTVSAEDILPYEAYVPAIEQTTYEAEAPGAHRAWYERDLERARTAARTEVLRGLIKRDGWYDLVFLDGGDFTSEAEFRLVQPYIRQWLVLDDTNPRMSIKNARNRDRVVLNPEWEVVEDHPDDRCGWLVARRR
jgi:predicted O-methyltransferase YrrM